MGGRSLRNRQKMQRNKPASAPSPPPPESDDPADRIKNRFSSYFSDVSLDMNNFPPIYWQPYTKHMEDLISLATSGAKDRIPSLQSDYRTWAADHNAKVSGDTPVETYSSHGESSSDDVDSDDTSHGRPSRPVDHINPVEAEPPTKAVLNTFCDILGQHEPTNRFILLKDLESHQSPDDDDSDEADKLCFCLCDDMFSQWMQKQLPGFDHMAYQCPHIHTYPAKYYKLLQHLEEYSDRCLFHNLIQIYITTLVSHQEYNRQQIHLYHLAEPLKNVAMADTSNDQMLVDSENEQMSDSNPGINSPSKTPEIEDLPIPRKILENGRWIPPSSVTSDKKSSGELQVPTKPPPKASSNGGNNPPNPPSRRQNNKWIQRRFRYSDSRRYDRGYDYNHRNWTYYNRRSYDRVKLSCPEDNSSNPIRYHRPLYDESFPTGYDNYRNDRENPPLLNDRGDSKTSIVPHDDNGTQIEGNQLSEVATTEPASASSQSSSRKRKNSFPENDVSVLTDSPRTSQMSIVKSIVSDFAKNTNGKSMTIKGNGMSIEVIDNNDNSHNKKKKKKPRKNTPAQIARRNRARAKKRKNDRIQQAIQRDSQSSELQQMTLTVEQLNRENTRLQEQLRGMDRSTTEDSHNTNNLVDTTDTSYSCLIENLNLSSNTSSLPAINENNSLRSATNSNNQQLLTNKPTGSKVSKMKNGSGSMVSSLSSSSSSDGLYDPEDCWEQIRKRVDIDEATKSMADKLRNGDYNAYSIINSDALSSGIEDVRRMYKVTVHNPLLFGRYPFLDEKPHIVTKKYAHPPPENESEKMKILIIGIGYPDTVRKLWMSADHPIKHLYVQNKPLVAYSIPDLDKFKITDETQQKEVGLSNVVKRDFLRSLVTETYAAPCRIYTVNNLKDIIRAPVKLSPYEINCNCNRHDFVTTMQNSNWKVHKVIFDNYRMQNAYVAANFTKSFFSALKDMARKDILCDADDSVQNNGRIYLPFNAHFFYFIHAYKFNKDFYISYLVNDDINWFNNTLHYATENNLFKDLVKIHKIELETDHISNARCTKKEILDYDTNLSITRDDLKDELDKLKCDVESIRYIVLAKKPSVDEEPLN